MTGVAVGETAFRTFLARVKAGLMITLVEKHDLHSDWAESGTPEFHDKPSPAFHTQESTSAAAILIVEDDQTIRETLADILEFEGYTVATVPNGLEALTYLRGNPAPKLILLDLMMPQMSGWELRIRQMQEPKLASIPVVILSGVQDLRQQATTLSVAAYLAKPIDMSLLFAAVRRYCG